MPAGDKLQAEEAWRVLQSGDLQALKRATHASFDWKTSLSPFTGITPLQQVVMNCSADRGLNTQWVSIAQWLLDHGACPLQLAGKTASTLSIWKDADKDSSLLKQEAGSRSAMTFCLELRLKMQKARDHNWKQEMVFLSDLVNLFSENRANDQGCHIPVDPRVVDLWDAMLTDKSDHDAVLETADGECTAHVAVLSRASHVLKASFTSEMREGKSRRVSIPDCSSAGMGIFLELIYTGGLAGDVRARDALQALEQAHCWQVDHVVTMLETAVKGLLSDETFEEIACTAQRMELQELRQACIRFAETSDAIQKKRDNRVLLPAVMKLLGRPPGEAAAPANRKKRKML